MGYGSLYEWNREVNVLNGSQLNEMKVTEMKYGTKAGVMKRQAASEGTERKTARNVIQSTHFNSIKLIEIE